ncbi:sugar ABC transporter permease [Clostridia bacterium]|nr:sugar ABC transporter permease [Clostridia bacterium]
MHAVIVKKKKKINVRRGIFIALMLAYPICHFLIFWLFVNINTVVLSFKNPTTGALGFWHYKLFWNELTGEFGGTLRRTIVNSLLMLPFNNFILLPLSVIAAYLLFQKVLGHRVFRVVFFFPTMISIVVLTMVFQFMFNSDFGPVNSLLRAIGAGSVIPPNGWMGTKTVSMGMIMVYCLWAGIGYNVVLITGAISRIPQDIFEAGRIDGIKMGRELWSVVVPLIYPTLSTLFVLGSTVVFTLFLQPKLLTAGGPNGTSQTIALYVVSFVEGTQLERAAATGMVFSVIGVPVILGIKRIMERFNPKCEF